VPLVTETNVSPAFFAWNQTHVDLDVPPPFRSAACVNRPITDCDRRGVAASISLSIMTAIQSDASHCSRALPRSDSGRRTLMRHFGEIVATMQSQCRNGFGVVTR
jgi:hypothetical protein